MLKPPVAHNPLSADLLNTQVPSPTSVAFFHPLITMHESKQVPSQQREVQRSQNQYETGDRTREEELYRKDKMKTTTTIRNR